MTEIKLKLKCPLVPSFISVENSEVFVSVSDLTDEQLIELANEWKQQLLEKAKKFRVQK